MAGARDGDLASRRRLVEALAKTGGNVRRRPVDRGDSDGCSGHIGVVAQRELRARVGARLVRRYIIAGAQGRARDSKARPEANALVGSLMDGRTLTLPPAGLRAAKRS